MVAVLLNPCVCDHMRHTYGERHLLFVIIMVITHSITIPEMQLQHHILTCERQCFAVL